MSDDTNQGGYVTAGPDDCISSIAEANGFFWKTIWNHPKNADLKDLRQNPNVLMEGDQVWIPPLDIKKVPASPSQRHTFKKKGVPAVTRFKFMKDGQPQANEPYVLNIDGNLTRGQTDGTGMVTISIPPGAQDASLLLGPAPKAKRYNLKLGTMDPISTESGVRKRLQAMGFNPGSADDDTDGEGLKAAVSRFQLSQNVEATGVVDAALRSSLVKAFGC